MGYEKVKWQTHAHRVSDILKISLQITIFCGDKQLIKYTDVIDAGRRKKVKEAYVNDRYGGDNHPRPTSVSFAM